jgi:predicted nucleic-acid-binding Zn-ribbon protein
MPANEDASKSPMTKCPKCGGTDIQREEGRLEGAFGGSRLFFDVYICNNCKYSELYFLERTYVYLGH